MVRERPVDAVVLSVRHCATERAELVDHLARDFPDVPIMALVTRHDPGVAQTLLRLGATGVREAVDVTAPSGWSRLRQLVAEPATRGAARILAPVMAALPRLEPDGRIFLEILIREAPGIAVVRRLARQLGVRPSTLMSRFARAGLPSPKAYLAAVRLLYAAQYFEGGGRSIADVAYRLECSSPQSFGRSMRATLGMTPGEFRRRLTFAEALDRFLKQLVEPYVVRWESFRPLRAGGRTVGQPDG